MKLPLVVLVGPTAVGKTALSVAVAQAVGAEIISGDSMQVYRGMDIGTAKIRPEEMGGVPHHLIDIKDPDEEFSVAEFQARVDALIPQICARGRLPMLVGGTGLYVRAVVEKYTFTPMEADHELRARLRQEEERHGPGYLHARLREVDPASAARLHPNDLLRIVRALEVYEQTGVPISATQTAAFSEPRYDDLMIGLTMDRAQLYARIDERVDAMLAAGWLDEVRGLLVRYPPHVRAMQALGYRELVLYLRGLLTWEEAVALIKRNTRRFAKRQFTWFRKERRLTWLDLTGPEARNRATEEIVRLIREKWPCRERKGRIE
ncbi:tRNA (adenosine(37)-N6)-dimethylallyltransferase MiaA [Symbiobacterium thermophilum]|uniref:tRNA dimethylallyltransferase n=1 Tax=Symbiobacterium thermophilum (strain DSM 24528 / JCM 14929 / IAM 14863 / T) TaxID=292459 RepID=MIAA_SYMTH|nr:tRNA (adenosine(37)-N6)-dimethylallyltransferase MiaA [Symbiobacterium thermophilum]Q67NL1.1 RecName: Full=tRNA dimethylallyltransferase; AltName: Full=Dimethylallyl diphosphate:tRNA dimethylallyltransferase; Short=DMAPP:tRNA dimethylallyltransferase; Short=DMATase; AltName: Full=Isopentenyl-diphosphate:tRNA isopentenyltransferase; Short=IPP transferase; Short=IPPT; Short=IPTase [Symbiobacterium thermophilum IAM 14863]BAD40732.1 tRNA isopentenylpyrophosphate transferase [Symbiobacterium thermo